ncbi:MAG: pentapeptide repeat-containing protein [Thermoguttaceae bacterium]|nr:pentapeptide repeat-containing protein [Thermoguttaceae bacterium]
MAKDVESFKSFKYGIALTLAVCFTLTGCDGDDAYVQIVGETGTTADAPRLDPLTLSVNDEMIDRELARFEESENVQIEEAASTPDSQGTPDAESVPARQDPVAEEKNPVDDFFHPDPTIDRLTPTRFILVDGEPARLEDGMDLHWKDLSGIRINNVTLSNVDFSGAKLWRADFSQARFYRCNFHGANFADYVTGTGGLVVEDTHFLDCDFTDASVCSDSSLPLTREEFITTHNYKSKFIDHRTYIAQNDDFSNFIFVNARIKNAQGCNFTDARFYQNCSVTDMTKEQLFSTYNYREKDYVGGLTLSNAEKDIKSLSGADFSRCRISSLTFHNYDVSNVDFTDAFICGTLVFSNCVGLIKEQLESTCNWKNRIYSFSFGVFYPQTGLDWSNTDFSGFRFETGASLGSGSVEGADFTDSIINYYTLQSNQNVTVEQIKSTWNFKNREMKLSLGKTDLDWSGTDFSNFTFQGNALDGADVTGADFTDAVFHTFYPLQNCRGLTIEQVKSTRNYKTGHMAGMNLPKEIADQLRAEREQNKTNGARNN